MTAVAVRPALDSADLAAWITFPRQHVYGPTSPWTPPLDADLRRALDPQQNPFFGHGEGVPLLAVERQGAVVGRVLAHIYHRHNVRHGERAAFFGYFECRDDVAAARALIDAAATFGRQRGCTVLRGPFNMTAMQEMGILLDGFDAAPALDETYTAPYYPALLEAAGLRPVFPVTTFRIDDLSRVDPDALLGERRALLAGGRLRVRPANLKAYDREIETLRELLNDSFYDNPHFVPITHDEFLFQVGPFKRVMDPAISLIAELDGVPVGFAIVLPDFNPLLRQMRGGSGPRALLTFLRGRSRQRGASLIIMGVQRQLQGQGIMRVLHAELVRALRRRGYWQLTVTWIADVNAKSRATVEALGARPLHRLTLYELPLDDRRLASLQTAVVPAWLEGARTAPSAHNTQPWRFTPLTDGRVAVCWEAARELPAADPTNRDLFLALGAAVESARLRAAAVGLSLAFAPAPEVGNRLAGWLVPAAAPADPGDRDLASLLDVRHTARVPHLSRPVPLALLAALRTEAARYGCGLYVVTRRVLIARLATLARRATAAQFADRSVQAELWHWLRLDRRNPAYWRDGLTADCLGLRGPALAVARLTMPPARMRRLARLGLHHLLALDLQRVVRRSAALCLLTAPSAAPVDLLLTGGVLQRLWLLAARAGLTTHPVSALLDCAATAGPTVAVFGARGDTPAALFRLGATPPVARAPRLPPEELLLAPSSPPISVADSCC